MDTEEISAHGITLQELLESTVTSGVYARSLSHALRAMADSMDEDIDLIESEGGTAALSLPTIMGNRHGLVQAVQLPDGEFNTQKTACAVIVLRCHQEMIEAMVDLEAVQRAMMEDIDRNNLTDRFNAAGFAINGSREDRAEVIRELLNRLREKRQED